MAREETPFAVDDPRSSVGEKWVVIRHFSVLMMRVPSLPGKHEW